MTTSLCLYAWNAFLHIESIGSGGGLWRKDCITGPHEFKPQDPHKSRETLLQKVAL